MAGWQRIINDHQRMMVQWHHTHHTSCACGALVETTELLLALISIMQQAGGDMRRLRGDKEVDDEVDVHRHSREGAAARMLPGPKRRPGTGSSSHG